MTAKTTVESFGQAILDLIVAASEREIPIELPTRAKATRLRQQIYQCRAAMRREGHYLLSKAEEVVVPAPVEVAVLAKPGDNMAISVWVLTPQPQTVHEDFLREALNRVGVRPLGEQAAEEVSPPPAPIAEDKPTTGEASIADYLGRN